MSFILDALRKSENQRQQQATPGIADARYQRPSSNKGKWLLVVAAVLGLNAILIAVLLLRDTNEPDPVRVVQESNVPPAPQAPARRPAQVPVLRDDVRSLAAEMDIARPAQAPAAAVSPAPTLAAPPSTPAPAPTPAATVTSGVTDDVPSMQQLVLDGRLEMTPLRLDMHVYGTQSSERFVFINMTKYRQGESLKEGPVVDEITSNGVVLSFRGERFSLDR
ncbi:MAG: general secretion pathway protein GspB [Gammaproteobacteria bacterium]